MPQAIARVQQLRLWRPDGEKTGISDFQAQIDIAKSFIEMLFIQTADRFIHFLANHQACTGYRRVVLLHLMAVQVPLDVLVLTDEDRTDIAVQTEDQPGLSGDTTNVHQLGADDAYFRTLGLVDQGSSQLALNTSASADSRTRYSPLASALARLYSAEPLRRWSLRSTRMRPPLPSRLLSHSSVVGLAVVIDDQHFVALIAGALLHADQCTLQMLQIVLALQDDRHHRPLSVLIVDLLGQRQRRTDLGTIPRTASERVST